MKLFKTLLISVLLISFTQCAYYNTFFNAEENYRIGLEKKRSNNTGKVTPDIAKLFNSSINKSWKVINLYTDSSSWSDDALLLIGKAHFQLEEFKKSQSVFEQFLRKYIKSPLIPEAELWLAKTYLMLEDDESALERFRSLINKTDDEQLLGDSYFNIGELYYNLGDYENAVINFLECINISSDESTSGDAQMRLGDSYLNLKQYENAVSAYQEVLYYNLPVLKQYDAVIQMVNALLELGNYDKANDILNNLLRDQRFKSQYSLLATKLANMIDFQGDTEYAMEKYEEVVNNYPKSEGAALSMFYLAQNFEFDYGMFDSAKAKYDLVPKTYSKSDAVKDARARSSLLKEYIDIRDGLLKDKQDKYRLLHGDSLLVDSLVTGADTVVVDNNSQTGALSSNPDTTMGTEDIFNQGFEFQNNTNENTQSDAQKTAQQKVVKQKKIAVNRSPEDVEISMIKNAFRKAEYFLLKYQHIDSAEVSYLDFVNNYYDSLLTPKAYYSLYYLYKDLKNNTERADSFKSIVLTRFPETLYGRKLSGKEVVVKKDEDTEIKKRYLSAEDLIDQAEYRQAISIFNQIAESDSGTTWAKKSRYASAYVYENFLKDHTNAVAVYNVLAKEYPESEYAKIAKKKIAEPPPEPEPKPEIKEPEIESKAVSSDSLTIDNKKQLDESELEKERQNKKLDEEN